MGFIVASELPEISLELIRSMEQATVALVDAKESDTTSQV